MPELPEVETIRRSLLPHVVRSRITRVAVRERRLRRRIAPDFERRLRGQRIRGVERRGKYLLFRLDGGETLLVHLGMSGRLTLRPLDAPVETHDHIRIVLNQAMAMVFNDPRRFGLMRVGKPSELNELLRVGRDPLVGNYSADTLRVVTRARRLPIKNLLMDQRVFAGIGNIYANEILYEAGIRPRRRASGLRRRELARLLTAMPQVLAKAVQLGGSSISDYRDANGRPGLFQNRHAVYDRAGEPCRRCGAPIRRIVLSGRGTFYCAKCQR